MDVQVTVRNEAVWQTAAAMSDAPRENASDVDGLSEGKDGGKNEGYDEGLLERWQAGDESAGATFVDRNFLRVYRFFANKLPADAQDLTQQTFADLHRSVGRVRSAPSLPAYLMGIARNNLYMTLRKRATRKAAFDPEHDAIGLVGEDISPSRIVARRQEERILLTALRKVPAAAQVVLELYYWESMSVKEIANVVGVQPGTVMSRLSRARDRLREAIEGIEADPTALASTLASLDGWAQGVRDEVIE